MPGGWKKKRAKRRGSAHFLKNFPMMTCGKGVDELGIGLSLFDVWISFSVLVNLRLMEEETHWFFRQEKLEVKIHKGREYRKYYVRRK